MSGEKVDKFKATSLTPLPAKYVRPPIIRECPVNIECRVRDIIHLAYMDRDVFAGDTMAIHIDEDIIGEDGLPDLTKFNTIAFASNKYCRITHYLEHSVLA